MFLGRRIGGRFCVALIALALYGCPQDGDDGGGGGGGSTDPKLNLLINARCGNMLAIPTREELTAGEVMTAEVSVQGIDPGQSSREILPGTDVTFFIADEKGEPGGSGGRFSSGEAASSGIRFNGGRAADVFFCTAPGIVNIHAQIGTLKEGRVSPSEYPPGSGLRPVIRTDKALGGFPIQCVSREAYDRACVDVPAGDAALFDAGDDTDAGDAGVDSGTDGGESDMTPPPPRYSLSYDSPPPAELVMVIRDAFRAGASDHIDLKFRVTDAGNAPRQRLDVRFDLVEPRQPGAAVQPAQATTDAEGYVTVQLRSGGTPGLATVRASVRVPDVNEPLQTVSPPVIIRAGVPSHRGLQLECEKPVVTAFTDRDPANPGIWGVHLRDATRCVAQLADRIGGRVDEPTQVIFFSEAGSVTQANPTDPAVGVAETLHRSGVPVPADVEPLDYEIQNDLVTGSFNPRDGVVTMIAVTRGEEGFLDVDGDHVYDEGLDVFDNRFDLPEPLVDSNDNGRHDEGEQYRDLNANGVWDEGNGTWDNNTEIWDATRVLWTGSLVWGPGTHTRLRVSGCLGDDLCFDGPQGNAHAGCPEGLDFYLLDGGRFSADMQFVDINGNCIDGYNQGAIKISTELVRVEGIPLQFTIDECFVGRDQQQCGGLCPGPSIYDFSVSDPDRNPPPMPGQPPPPAKPASVTVEVTFQAADDRIVTVPFSLRGCVQ